MNAASALPLRELVLAALAEAAILRRAEIGFCADCRHAPGGCPDHAQDAADAGEYEAAYMRVAGIGGDGAALTLITGSTP